MFTGFIKCDCNGVCIEVNPFICTTSTSTSTTTSTSTSTTTTTTTIAITSICFCIHVEGGGCAYQVELPILGNAPFQNGRPVYNITGDANGTVYFDGSQWIYDSEEIPILQPLLNSSYYPIGTYSEWGEVDTTYFMDSSTSGPCPTTTTTTTAANNRWQYEYLSYTCTLCEIIEYGSLYNSNPLTLDNFYQYGDIVITPYALLGVDTGISDASIPDTGVATCEEIDCNPTTTTTTTKRKICGIVSIEALKVEGGSWSALDCLGENVSGTVPFPDTIDTPCIEIDTLVLVDAVQIGIFDCETPITIECITYITGNGNVYAYDPITNLSIDIFNDSNTYFNVLNTDTKLWTQQSGGYLGEYNLTFSPGPVPTYDRLINLGGDIRPIFAIDNFTLIAFNPSTESIDELDITTTTATSTFVGSVESGYTVSDATLTTSGKLILVANSLINISSYSTKIYQYDYATWTLEIAFDVTSQLPSFVIGFTTYKSYIVGISQYEGEIYLFSRISNCAYAPNETTSKVYTLDLLTNTLIFTGNESGIACANKASSQLICNTVDIDPNIIPVPLCSVGDITIGTQTWTGCNLNVDTYVNGDPIFQATNAGEWNELTTGAWCYYDFDPANEAIYGKLYNWYAVTDSRGLAPLGYHIPTDAEWSVLRQHLDPAGSEFSNTAGAPLKETGTINWNTPNTGATNVTGFTGLPGGYASYFGTFFGIKDYGYWWAFDEYSSVLGWQRSLSYNNINLFQNGARKDSGLSVRCIKDSNTTTTTTTIPPTGFNTIYIHFEAL